MTTSDELLADVASSLRSLYIARRTVHLATLRSAGTVDAADLAREGRLSARWDGGEDSRGVRHQPCWPKLARFAVAQELNPRDWVDTLFNQAHLLDHAPWPSDLMRESVLLAVRRYAEERALDAYHRVRTETMTLLKEIYFRRLDGDQSGQSEDNIVRAVIIDPLVDASPLPRYVLAYRRGHLDLARGCERLALLQYRSMPAAYDGVFGDRLPARLRELLQQAESQPEARP